MSYSVCRHGGSMCDGCMSCYDDRYDEEDEILIDEEEEEEEEEDDD